MVIDSNFLSMEDEVIKKIIDNTPEYKDVLLHQYENVIKKERDFDPCGFYTFFEINKNKCTVIDKSLTLNSVYGSLNNDYIKVGFLLYIRNGYISMLECYEIFDEIFPNKIVNYILNNEV